MELYFPRGGLALFVGPPGSGKTTVASRLIAAGQIRPSEVVSSDRLREQICDDLSDQSLEVTRKTFDLLHEIVDFRLGHGKRVLVDATNVEPHTRVPLVRLAREHACSLAAIVVDTPAKECEARNEARRGAKRVSDPRYLEMLFGLMRKLPDRLEDEGFQVVVLNNELEIENLVLTQRKPQELTGSRGGWMERRGVVIR